MEIMETRVESEGRRGYRGRGQNRREGGERFDRGNGRKVRDVKGDPNFWVKNGVVGDENVNHVADNMTTLGERENGKSSGSRSENSARGRGPKRKNILRTDDDVDLRDRLAEQLERGLTECMVCLDRVRQMHPTWDCHNCYQIFHFGCIKKWARTVTTEGGGWRCPGCQVVVDTLPRDYRCFCRKVRNPEWGRNEGLVPHSCGEVCHRSRNIPGCVHYCVELCHAGPCPPCTAVISVRCFCGKVSRPGKCGDTIQCGDPCGKMLRCGVHSCLVPCHPGECEECEVELEISCHCGASSTKFPCSKEEPQPYSCGAPCPLTLSCGHHPCPQPCHPGPCPPCQLSVDMVTHCPCGKATVEQLYSKGGIKPRISCKDPVPLCEQTCDKTLSCGPPSSPHRCTQPCHSGPCPQCPSTTSVKCRCGNMDQELPCTELTTRADDARCGKRCQKKRECGKHKCGEVCCIQVEHPCPLLCGRLLSCGLHRCDRTCHKGNCYTCHNVSFTELTCHCGAAVTFPPVPCGTKPPECRELCRRDHPCGHPVTHNCHSEPECPPCTTLTTKLCYGGHEQRRNVACLVEGISCGKPCGAETECGRHRCMRPCHPGPCTTTTCTQPCTVPRPCGHPCGAPCHPAPCPDTPCTTQVKITCSCGHRQAGVPCSDNAYSRVTTALLATRMQDMQAGNSVDLAELAKRDRKLECNDECLKLDRNTRLAAALQITNPELTSKIIPRYSEFMKDWVRRDSNFCNMVHTKLVDLVKLAKESKQKSRAFSFPCMNRDKRQLVHEYAEHFLCESESYDSEPKRNVVVTALRDKSGVPSISLVECVGKQKKAPAPPPVQVASTTPTFTPLARGGSEPRIDWFD